MVINEEKSVTMETKSPFEIETRKKYNKSEHIFAERGKHGTRKQEDEKASH